MRSPSTAIAWERWSRYRWWLLAGFAYFLVIAPACQLLPQGTLYSLVRLYLIVPLLASSLGLVVVFVCDANADLGSSDSLFPQRMFTAPLSTRSLVGWPMLHGVSTVFVIWLAITLLALQTIQPDASAFRTALLAAACLAWLQTLAWTPFGMPYLRVVVGVPLVFGIVVLPAFAEVFGVPGIVIGLVLAIQIPLAYGLATAGVAHARRGDNPDWSRLIGQASSLVRWYGAGERTFPTASQAQRWLEWRRNGLGLTLAILLSTPFVLLLSAFTMWRVDIPPALTWFFSPLSILAIPVMAAISAGAEFGLFRASPRESGPCAFLATRPLSSTDFVLAKLGTALRAVLVCYAVALPAFVLVTLLSGWQHKMLDGLLYLSGGSPIGAIGITLLTLLLVPALAWKFTVENMFVGLCGRKWVTTIVIPGLAATFWLLPALGWWISWHPELLRISIQAAPWLLAFLVGAKLLLVAYVYRVLKRRRLLEPTTSRAAATVWLAAVVLLSGLALWLIPAGLMPWHSVICGAVLMVPLARIGLAPLALAWNRHR